ncbi:MAG: inositol monophosphatase family protein [bacterium]
MAPSELLDAAVEAARACGAYLLDNYRQPKSGYEEKSPGDLVSEVDRTSQSMAREILLTRTPDAHYMAEEGEAASGGQAAGEELVWIVDPLDGTANFLHRFPAFSISIAAARGRELLAGAVFNPVTDELFTAARGEGAALGGEPIRVSEEEDLARGLLATGWPFRRLELMDDYLDVFKRVFRRCQGMRRPGAASLDLAYTAAGRLEGYWEFGLKIWDLAAGALIVEEAGGRVSGFAGGGEWWESGDIVATNRHVHEALLEAADIPGGLEELEKRAGASPTL